MPPFVQTIRGGGSAPEKAFRVGVLALCVSILLALAKGITGITAQSQALIADAVESLLDVFGGLAIVVGMRVASTPPDKNHPYGHGKAEPLAAMTVASLIMLGGAGLAYNSILTLWQGTSAVPAAYSIPVIVVVIVIKESLFHYVNRTGQAIGSSALLAEAWHHRTDAITSIATLLGVTCAVVGGERWAAADDLAALFACTIILYNGQRLLRPALAELMDAAPPPAIEGQVRTIAQDVPGVEGLDKCHVRKMGLEYYVDLHVLVDPEMTVRESHRIAHEVRDAIVTRENRVRDVLVHMEPSDLYGDGDALESP